MSIKSKVFAATAALTLVGGVGAAGAVSASAATPSSGFSSIEVFSPIFGTHHQPTFVLDMLRQGEKVGQPHILFRVTNNDPAEDFTISYQGLVSDFFAAGLVTSAVDLHYGGGALPGSPTTSRTRSSTRLTAWTAACAPASARPRWPVPRLPWSRVASPPRPSGSSTPRTRRFSGLRAADQRLGHELLPAVRADLPGATAYPTDMPRPQLYVTNLTGFSNGTAQQPVRCGRQPAVGLRPGRPPVGES